MKQYIHIIKMIPAALLLCACSDTDNLPANKEEFGPQVEEFTTSMTNISAGAEVRATSSPYVVNTDGDPTKTLMKDRSGWEMDVQIYKGENAYTPGEATYKYETDKWNIQNNATLRFPNYTKQKIKATFHPSSWSTSTTTAIATDQSGKEGAKILAQDILIENEAGKLYNPAKKIEIEMKHANSMLDFIIKDVAANNIASITVTIAGTEYTPYQAKTGPIEYLLIVPTTTTDAKNPTIKIVTQTGATYQQEIKLIGAKHEGNAISNYEVNTCYCFTLNGLELILSPITITDWSTGTVEAGDYIAVTAYPTFRGTPNKTYYVYYDNCLKNNEGNPIMQEIKFNSRGECTIKPDGRIITHIGTTNEFDKAKNLTSPVLLSDMIVDLNSAITELSQNSTTP